jgi:hypothetical protein
VGRSDTPACGQLRPGSGFAAAALRVQAPMCCSLTALFGLAYLCVPVNSPSVDISHGDHRLSRVPGPLSRRRVVRFRKGHRRRRFFGFGRRCSGTGFVQLYADHCCCLDNLDRKWCF